MANDPLAVPRGLTHPKPHKGNPLGVGKIEPVEIQVVAEEIPTPPVREFSGCSDQALRDALAYPQLMESLSQRFWRNVDKGEPGDCWPWLGATGGGGYGRFKIKSYTTIGAHRMAYALAFGERPGLLHVCHRCDNPPCVNPAHLFLGTNLDNVADKMAKGRAIGRDQHGAKNGAAKLTEAQVAEIRERISAGETNTAIALDYAVTHQLISRIRRGRAWGETAMQPKYASLKTPAAA